jgi:hypothetical protein
MVWLIGDRAKKIEEEWWHEATIDSNGMVIGIIDGAGERSG